MTTKSEKYLKRIRKKLKQSGLCDSENILEQFRKKFPHLLKLGLQIGGIANLISDSNVISVSTPFIFDNRLLPKSFMGLDIRSGTNITDLPKEFQNINPDNEYIWAYQRFEEFVDNNATLIREKLNNPNMTRNDMLDALCFGDFKRHEKQCLAWEAEGKIPKYKK
jgi:hypothetical protein